MICLHSGNAVCCQCYSCTAVSSSYDVQREYYQLYVGTAGFKLQKQYSVLWHWICVPLYPILSCCVLGVNVCLKQHVDISFVEIQPNSNLFIDVSSMFLFFLTLVTCWRHTTALEAISWYVQHLLFKDLFTWIFKVLVSRGLFGSNPFSHGLHSELDLVW